MSRKIVSFDWALKFELRYRSNFVVLEGLLAAILGRKVEVVGFLDTESNLPDEERLRFRLDLQICLDDSELAIVELQYRPEYHSNGRLLLYTSGHLADRFLQSYPSYSSNKIYTVSICAFKLGNGEDYIYRGQQKLSGLHSKQELKFSRSQAKRLSFRFIRDIFPEYTIISLANFDAMKTKRSHLDEWLYALKTSKIEDDFSSPGINLAAELLGLANLTSDERSRYDAFCLQQQSKIDQARADNSKD